MFLLVARLACTQPTCNNKDSIQPAYRTVPSHNHTTAASIGAYVAPNCPRPYRLPYPRRHGPCAQLACSVGPQISNPRPPPTCTQLIPIHTPSTKAHTHALSVRNSGAPSGQASFCCFSTHALLSTAKCFAHGRLGVVSLLRAGAKQVSVYSNSQCFSLAARCLWFYDPAH